MSLPQFEINNILNISILMYGFIFIFYTIVNNFIIKYINTLYKNTDDKISIIHEEYAKLYKENEHMNKEFNLIKNKLDSNYKKDNYNIIKNYENTILKINDKLQINFNEQKIDLKNNVYNKYINDNMTNIISNIKIQMEKN